MRLNHLPISIGLLLATSAPAQERPSDEAIFGEPSSKSEKSSSPPTPLTPAAPTGTTDPDAQREEEALNGPAAKDAFSTGDVVEDPLKIGGQFYLRSLSQITEGTPFRDNRFSMPTLVDGYFDARPNEHVRGMVVGRLSFDPTLPAGAAANPSSGTTQATTSVSSFVPQSPGNPYMVLDQAWLNFDIARTVFVTAGKQHVKWGTSHIWSPTDFLTPERRNPLLFFDPRLGASMVKLHVPVEDRGWNFYAIGLLDNAGPSNTLGQIGGAARAEVLIGQAEVGVDGVAQRGRRPRAGVDFSSAIGPFDLYGEAALTTGGDTTLYRLSDPPNFAAGLSGLYEGYTPSGFTPSASGGANWSVPFRENDMLTLGVEYFYNSLGYSNPAIYPVLILNNAYQPFYLGRHYAALYANLSLPAKNTSVSLSNLGNLSDQSFVSQLGYSVRVLSYLTLEAFAAVHYGHKGGEFRLQLDTSSFGLPPSVVPPFFLPAPVVDLGLNLRIAL